MIIVNFGYAISPSLRKAITNHCHFHVLFHMSQCHQCQPRHNDDGEDGLGQRQGRRRQKVEIIEVLRPEKDVASIVDAVKEVRWNEETRAYEGGLTLSSFATLGEGFEYFTLADTRQIVLAYIDDHNLTKQGDGSSVVLDPLLTDALFKSRASKKKKEPQAAYGANGGNCG